MKIVFMMFAICISSVAAADPVPLPEGYLFETELAVFPALPKHALTVKVLKEEVLLTIEAVGRFPDHVFDNSAFAKFVEEFGYTKVDTDQLNKLELKMVRDACLYEPAHPEAIACLFATGEEKIKSIAAVGPSRRIDLTPLINGFFEGGLASRVTHGFEIITENQPRFHFSIRLSATGHGLNGRAVYSVLELKNQSAYFVKARTTKNL